MVVFITVLHIVLCLFLIVVVLLQTGKGADMGAAFGGASQTVFGATGALTLLHKVTTVTAVLFMLTSMGLAWHSSREQAGGDGLDEDIFDQEKQRAEEKEAAETEGTEGEETGTEAGEEEIPPLDVLQLEPKGNGAEEADEVDETDAGTGEPAEAPSAEDDGTE